MTAEPFQPRTVYRKGDLVIGENGNTYRALADFISGLLDPSLVVIDRPGIFWERIGR